MDQPINLTLVEPHLSGGNGAGHSSGRLAEAHSHLHPKHRAQAQSLLAEAEISCRGHEWPTRLALSSDYLSAASPAQYE